MGHTVLGSPSMASSARSGASASPSGENTVTELGSITCPAACGSLVCSEDSVGEFRPSSSPPRPSSTSPKMLLSTVPIRTTNNTSTAAPTLRPMIRPLRRRASASGSGSGFQSSAAGSGAASTGARWSVRSATAVACCSRFSSVPALRIAPPSWTARMAAAEIWNGMSRSTVLGSTGWPAASRSACARPLGSPRSGSGQRLTSSAYSAAPIPRMSFSGVASGSVAGNASATSPSMLTRIRLG